MAMTLDQALAFRLPNGTTIAKASTQDWLDAYVVYDTEDLDELDTVEALQASIDKNRGFREALKVIEANQATRLYTPKQAPEGRTRAMSGKR